MPTSPDRNEPPSPSSTEPRTETIEEEQLRKFTEREKQWGGD